MKLESEGNLKGNLNGNLKSRSCSCVPTLPCTRTVQRREKQKGHSKGCQPVTAQARQTVSGVSIRGSLFGAKLPD